MKTISIWAIAFSFIAGVMAQPPGNKRALERATVPCLTEAKRAAIKRAIAASRKQLIARGLLVPKRTKMQPALGFPLRLMPHSENYHGWSVTNYVDHDTVFPDMLRDYNGGTRTYDTEGGYNHQGTDYATWPFGWSMMDGDEVAVVAAAPGTIVYKEGRQPDKSCSFDVNTDWNAVYVEHADGSLIWYGHLKTASLTAKAVGETVAEEAR